ncbi:MAG: hypothetical protein WAW61_16025 [Methylococcaceae bacterium]
MTLIDEYAARVAIERYALPPCLHIPIAARDEDTVRAYVGDICKVLMPGTPNRALLVEVDRQTQRDDDLPIWQLPEASILHYPQQLWVHVDYHDYRKAYAAAFPNYDLTGLVLDHVMNRRVARLKGFYYLRIVPISREANSSSGGLSEKWGVEYHSTLEMRAKNLANPAKIQYADLADIVKMLNRKTGGTLQDPVNEAQSLVRKHANGVL